MHANNIFNSSYNDNKNGFVNNARSPARPQNQSSSKKSYVHDYNRFLEKQEQMSETKSQASQNSNNNNNKNQYQNGHNYNKSQNYTSNKSTNVGFSQPNQNSQITPNQAKNTIRLNHVGGQETTAATLNKNRSNSQSDMRDIKKRINLDNNQSNNQTSGHLTPHNYNQQQANNNNKQTVKVPQSILKLESGNNNQYTFQGQKKNQQNGFDENDVQTPNSHSRRESHQFQKQNQQQRPQYQQEQYNNNYENNQNYQNDQASVSSTSSNKYKQQQYSTHQQHYQDLIQSPPSETKNFQKGNYDQQADKRQSQNPMRISSTTPKRMIDLTSNLGRKGSNQNQNQNGQNQYENQPNFDDDNKSVSSQASHISQLVCSNCINKDLMNERELKKQQNREKQIQLERNAIDADKDNLYNSCMNQHEEVKNAQKQFARDIQEQIDYKNDKKREEHEREVSQRKANQIKLQEEQEKALQKKIEDVKNQRNMLNKDMENQQQIKQQRLEKEKESDRKLQDMLAAQREHDVHNQMAQLAEKKNQTKEIRDGLLEQLEEKKKKQEEIAQENAKQRKQLEKQLQIDMETRDKKLQEKADEIKRYQDHWNLQQDLKEKQKMDQKRENEKFKEGQQAILENDKEIYYNNIEKEEQVKRAAARGLLDQISARKDQKQKDHEQKLLQGQKLREQQARDLELAKLNYHDCDRCHATFPTNNLTKQRTYKSKSKSKFQI